MQSFFNAVGIVGTGAMGRGIAQMVAQAGAQVWLRDAQEGAADTARATLVRTWQGLVAKNRMSPETMAACESRLHVATSTQDLAGCDLVIEAIVERLDVKQALFKELEFGRLLRDLASAETLPAAAAPAQPGPAPGPGAPPTAASGSPRRPFVRPWSWRTKKPPSSCIADRRANTSATSKRLTP